MMLGEKQCIRNGMLRIQIIMFMCVKEKNGLMRQGIK